MAAGIVSQMNWIYLLGILTNIVLNVLLIPTYGAWGAAIATLATQSVIMLSQIVMTGVVIKTHLSGSFWLRLLLFCVLVIGSTYGMKYFIQLDWRVAFFALGSFSFLLALLLRLIDFRGVKELV